MIPDSIPYRDLLETNGITELEQIPTTKTGLTALDGIGPAKADGILKALEALPEASEPEASEPEVPATAPVQLKRRSWPALCRLKKDADYYAVVVGGVEIRRDKAAMLSQDDYERLAGTYGLELAD